jgi:hypothetical protein
MHELRPEDAGDVLTWMVTYLNAYLDVQADPGAMGRFIRMSAGDRRPARNAALDVHVPFANAQGEARTREFWNRDRPLSSSQRAADIDVIDTGKAGPGWERTGESFKIWPQMPSDTLVPPCPYAASTARPRAVRTRTSSARAPRTASS